MTPHPHMAIVLFIFKELSDGPVNIKAEIVKMYAPKYFFKT